MPRQTAGLDTLNYQRFYDLVHAKSGLSFPDSRRWDLERAVLELLVETNSQNLDALYELPDELRARKPLEDELAAHLTGGHHLCIRGYSRIGKTTLLNCIAGKLKPDAGSVFYDGTDVHGLSEARRRFLARTEWGFVNQDAREGLRMGVEIFHALRDVLKGMKLNTAVGDEGGFAPNLKRNEDACELIAEAVEKAGYDLGRQIVICLDPATSELANEAKKVKKKGKNNGN